DPIRLKNLLHKAEKTLLARGTRPPDIQDLLAPAYHLVDESLFWRFQNDGLALFLAPGDSHHYRLPLRLEEMVVVNDRYYIKPLLPLLTDDGRYYVLSLSQKNVNLYQCTRDSIQETDLGDTPKNLEEALSYDLAERQLQFHTGSSSRRGEQPAIYHGHGLGLDQARHKQEILRFLQKVSDGVRDLLKDESVPLVLAGVGYLHPLYRETNNYPHLLKEGILGSPEGLRPDQLLRKAWEIVQPEFEGKQRRTAERYRQWVNTDRVSQDIREIVPAAHQGRVESLFVALGVQKWGLFHPADRTVESLNNAEPGAEDMLNLAAQFTLMNGGTVYAVKPEDLPLPGAMAACFFRY
ncbi:MAG: hypothetical protein HY548_07930, partial [Elusimicrobia bacterium]|nr:hypothetical protein [Elusimicrobiota bacterium]